MMDVLGARGDSTGHRALILPLAVQVMRDAECLRRTAVQRRSGDVRWCAKSADSNFVC
jgi:hypothetical protein